MSLSTYINSEIFQPLEQGLKSDLWIECRNMITTCFLDQFKHHVLFARALYATARQVRTEGSKIKPSQLSSIFMKIERVSRLIAVDPIKSFAGICEIFITTKGQFLLDDEMCEQIFELLTKWTGMMHRCNATGCVVGCLCRVKFCDQVIACTGEDFNVLCKAERPGLALFHSFCGPMIRRASTMLDEINQHIPSYTLIDKSNCYGLRKLLMDYGIGFQMTYTKPCHFWLRIDNEDDRCGAKKFIQLMMPVRDTFL